MKIKNTILIIILITSFFIIPAKSDDLQPLSDAQTILLRPNANGKLNEWLPYLGLWTPGGTNWDNVNDVTPDGLSTLVKAPSTNGLVDWYQTTDPTTSSGTIVNVTLYAVIGKGGPGTGGIDFLINDSVIENSSTLCSVTGTYSPWAPSTIQYTFELSPDGNAWAWDDVADMEIGIRTNISGTFIQYCTQVYAEIKYLSNGTFVDDDALPEWYDSIHVHTIQEGIDNASENQTVYVHNGTYAGGISIGKTLTISGEARDTVIVDCGGTAGFTLSAQDISISFFTITNGTNGIYQSSSDAIISNNLITENNVGVYLYHSNDNQILYNTFQLNEEHIELNVADGNTITENIFENASSDGVYASLSDNNQINSNNFINNSNQAYDDGANYWDNGYWGNYWDDYIGTDANYDGRGDTPFDISGGSNKDNYPLMLPWAGPVYVFVDLAYNPSTPGWGVTRFNTLASGVSAGADGTCYVYPGTYPHILINNRINLVGDNKNATIITGAGGNNAIFFNPGTEHSTVSGFKIIDASGGSGEGNAGIYALRDYSTVYNCIFENDKTAIRLTSDYITIHHCLFIDNTYRSLRWEDGDDCVVHNCTFINNTGIYIHFNSDNNVIVDNYFNSSHIALHIAYYSNNNYFMRNLVIGQESAGVEVNQMGDKTSSDNNHIYLNNFYNISNGGAGLLDWHTTTRANHYNNSTIGNFYDDYQERYPGATNDGYVWDTPLDLAVGAQKDYYPAVLPFDFAHSYPSPLSNQPVFFLNPDPSNNSVYNPLNLTWNITIQDPEGDSFQWTIECNGQSNGMMSDTNGTKSLSLSSLSYDTIYTVWVNATDNGALVPVSEWFLFTTRSGEPYAWDIIVDGVINYLDASSLVSHYGETGTPDWIRDDINDDGVVNYLDMSSLVSHYGESY